MISEFICNTAHSTARLHTIRQITLHNSNRVGIIPRLTLSTTNNRSHLLPCITQRPVSPRFYHSASTRIPPLLYAHRPYAVCKLATVLYSPRVARGMAFGAFPKLILAGPRYMFSALRIPAALAGVTVGTASYLESKADERIAKFKGYFSSITDKFNETYTSMQEGINSFELKIPEIEMPDFVKNLLTSSSQKNSSPVDSTTHEKQSDNSESQPDPSNGTSVAIGAAALAVALETKHGQNTDIDGDRTIPQHDEQFMMLTKKLIEIRSILLSIDHNETLKLPSIVVIGSQSSGKSSVLEAIVGHEFLPKGSNMVTRRPIELTLVHTPGSSEEYGEFPQLGLGKVHDFKQIQKTLRDLNLAVPESECVSDKPIELRIYSSNIPDLTLIDLPGYIQVHSRDQPETLKHKIEKLCENYIREPNIILAVCAADVDLANSPALNASRKIDPLGLRTIGVITKMDLVPPEDGAAILRNTNYPLHLGYIGVICKAPSGLGSQNMTGALIRNEERYFRSHPVYNQRGVNVGTETLRRKLMNVLEQGMGRSLYSIVDAVQKELEEARYQFKVQYNDRGITAESYVAETLDNLKHRFKEFTLTFGKPQVRHEVRTMLEQRVMDICAETYWSDSKISDLPKSAADDFYWLYKQELSAAALTKSGIGRSTTQLVVDALVNKIEQLAMADGLLYHLNARKEIIDFTNDILRSKFLTTSDQVENTIKPYKYDVEITDQEWGDGVKRSITLLERELDMCNQLSENIKNTVGKKRLRGAIKYLLDTEKKEQRRLEKVRLTIDDEVKDYKINDDSDADEDEVSRPNYSPKLLEKARESLFLRDRAIVLRYRIAALKSRQCKTQENKQFCPEVFLNVIAEKLTYTAVMFIQVELLNEFLFSFPRELDNRLVYVRDKKQIRDFAYENPLIKKHLLLQERKEKLEDVMEKLNFLVRRQQEKVATAKMMGIGGGVS